MYIHGNLFHSRQCYIFYHVTASIVLTQDLMFYLSIVVIVIIRIMYIFFIGMNANPFMKVYLICYFRVIDISIFNTDKIATFLKQVHHQRKNRYIIMCFLSTIDLSVDVFTTNCLSCV